jgi:hypothetical protein
MACQRIELALEEAEELGRRTRATTVSVGGRRRAEIIVLGCARSNPTAHRGAAGDHAPRGDRWAGRFALNRLDGLNDRAGRGRKCLLVAPGHVRRRSVPSESD